MRRKFKKITLPILVGVISFYISVIFLFGIISGYLLIRYLSRKIRSLQFFLGNYKIHLHHWLCSAFGLMILLISGFYSFFPIFILGFGSGIVFEGIYCYSDWYKIIIRKKRK